MPKLIKIDQNLFSKIKLSIRDVKHITIKLFDKTFFTYLKIKFICLFFFLSFFYCEGQFSIFREVKQILLNSFKGKQFLAFLKFDGISMARNTEIAKFEPCAKSN